MIDQNVLATISRLWLKQINVPDQKIEEIIRLAQQGETDHNLEAINRANHLFQIELGKANLKMVITPPEMIEQWGSWAEQWYFQGNIHAYTEMTNIDFIYSNSSNIRVLRKDFLQIASKLFTEYMKKLVEDEKQQKFKRSQEKDLYS